MGRTSDIFQCCFAVVVLMRPGGGGEVIRLRKLIKEWNHKSRQYRTRSFMTVLIYHLRDRAGVDKIATS